MKKYRLIFGCKEEKREDYNKIRKTKFNKHLEGGKNRLKIFPYLNHIFNKLYRLF
jgi:hypothetical protein